jgi:hypothetical protein
MRLNTYNPRASPSFSPNYGYGVAPECTYSPLEPTRVWYPTMGYPYMPHNPTLEEREACGRRISAVKARHAFPAQPTMADTNRHHSVEIQYGGSQTGGTARRPGPDRPHLSVNSHFSGGEEYEEEEDSDGPDTPHSPQNFLWQDWAAGTPQLQDQQTRPGTVYYGTYPYESIVGTRHPDTQPTFTEHARTDELEPLTEAAPSIAAKSTAAHAEIQQLIYELNNLVLAFKFPSNLEFATLSTEEGSLPELAHTPANRPLQEHNHKLDKLLERLDGIQSNGDPEVQKIRKRAVDQLIQEFERLKRMQAMAWYNVSVSLAKLYSVS